MVTEGLHPVSLQVTSCALRRKSHTDVNQKKSLVSEWEWFNSSLHIFYFLGELAPFTFTQLALASFFWCFGIAVASMAALVEMGPKMARVARGKIREWVRVAQEKIQDHPRERRMKRDQV